MYKTSAIRCFVDVANIIIFALIRYYAVSGTDRSFKYKSCTNGCLQYGASIANTVIMFERDRSYDWRSYCCTIYRINKYRYRDCTYIYNDVNFHMNVILNILFQVPESLRQYHYR